MTGKKQLSTAQLENMFDVLSKTFNDAQRISLCKADSYGVLTADKRTANAAILSAISVSSQALLDVNRQLKERYDEEEQTLRKPMLKSLPGA